MQLRLLRKCHNVGNSESILNFKIYIEMYWYVVCVYIINFNVVVRFSYAISSQNVKNFRKLVKICMKYNLDFEHAQSLT